MMFTFLKVYSQFLLCIVSVTISSQMVIPMWVITSYKQKSILF